MPSDTWVRYLELGYFLFLLFQISLFGSFHVFLWPIMFPLIYTLVLLFLEQKRGHKTVTVVRLVMWLLWALYSFATIIVNFVAIGRFSYDCTVHPCIAGFEAAGMEIIVFIFLLPAIFITLCACTMFCMTIKEYRAPPGSYEALEESGGTSSVGSEAPAPSSGQSSYYTL